ncbi:hypothetical protein BGZ94_001718 [Podila epigama]|nr:hypothetical protein BGZ94_001718 [Podila epigama]
MTHSIDYNVFVQFLSGLEHFYKALGIVLFRQDSSTRNQLVRLGLRCILLQACINFLVWLTPNNACAAFNQLDFPTVLLYRYLYPQPFDQLFMTTLRVLGSANRSDIVATRGPSYMGQLGDYLYRTFRAYLALGTMHWLIHRRGIFALPSLALGLIAVYQVLRTMRSSSSGSGSHDDDGGHGHVVFRRPGLVLLIAVVFLGPRWPIWIIQSMFLQQLLIYELLQPYLARVRFKVYEERAWWALHQYELYGFGLGIWLICRIPWIGVGAFPAMLSTMAVLLTRSCGMLENMGGSSSSSSSLSSSRKGDVIEQLWPGIKTVAFGQHHAVRGDWDANRVETFVSNSPMFLSITGSMEFESFSHTSYGKRFYTLSKDRGVGIDGGEGFSTEEQVRMDGIIAQQRKEELYRDVQARIQEQQADHPRQQQQQQQQQRQLKDQKQTPKQLMSILPPPLAWSSPIKTPSAPLGPGVMMPSGGLSAAHHPDNDVSAHSRPVNQDSQVVTGMQRMIIAQELSRYDFYDRKAESSAPSAPPELLPAHALGPYEQHSYHGQHGRNEEDEENTEDEEDRDEGKEEPRNQDALSPLSPPLHTPPPHSPPPPPHYQQKKPSLPNVFQSSRERSASGHSQRQFRQRRSHSTPNMEGAAHSHGPNSDSEVVNEERRSGKTVCQDGRRTLPPSGIKTPSQSGDGRVGGGLSSMIALNLHRLEREIDRTFERRKEGWVKKLHRATTMPVQAAVSQATANVAAVTVAAEKARLLASERANSAAQAATAAATAATERATDAMTAAVGVWTDEKLKLARVAIEQRSKMKQVLGVNEEEHS